MLHYRRRRMLRRLGIPVAVLAGAAAIGAAIGVAPAMIPAPGYGETVSGCHVTDGDTLRCQGERIRLLAIDAPELPGHCQRGRNCAPGDPFASTRSLEGALEPQMKIERVGEDKYGRTLAIVASSVGDLSCYQLRRRQAIYRADWDNGLRVARICRADAR